MSDAAIADAPGTPGESLADLPRQSWVRAMLTSRSGVVGLCFLAVPVLLVLANLVGLLPYGASEQNPPEQMRGPSADHLFGTDRFGHDMFSRVGGGIANSAIIAILAVTLAAVVGTAAGVVAGFYRGLADSVVSGVTNILFAFPPLLLALALASVLDRSRFTVAVAIAVVYIPIFARVARGPVLTLREVDFVRAATSTGLRPSLVMLRHVLPNLTPVIIVQVTLSLSWAVLTEAALSYLGLGAPPPAPSLGSMIFEARSLMYRAPWTVIAPGAVVVALVVGLNLLGDGLRDALDPRRGGR